MAINLIFDSSKFNNVFDTLSLKIKNELDIQYEKKRILGSEYADTYSKLMDRVLQLSYEDQLQQKELSIKEEIADADIALKVAEQSLKNTQASELTLNGVADRNVKLKDLELRQAEIDLKDGQLSEMVLNGVVDRNLKQAEEELKNTQKEELLSNGTADRSLKQAEEEFKDTQKAELLLNGVADRDLKTAQKNLYDRQTTGFDENRDQKLFEAQCNAFSLMLSSGMLSENATVPAALGSDAMNAVYQSISGVDPSTL